MSPQPYYEAAHWRTMRRWGMSWRSIMLCRLGFHGIRRGAWEDWVWTPLAEDHAERIAVALNAVLGGWQPIAQVERIHIAPAFGVGPLVVEAAARIAEQETIDADAVSNGWTGAEKAYWDGRADGGEIIARRIRHQAVANAAESEPLRTCTLSKACERDYCYFNAATATCPVHTSNLAARQHRATLERHPEPKTIPGFPPLGEHA